MKLSACINLCWKHAFGHKFFRAWTVCRCACRTRVMAAGTSELSLHSYVSQASGCLAGLVPSRSGVGWTSPGGDGCCGPGSALSTNGGVRAPHSGQYRAGAGGTGLLLPAQVAMRMGDASCPAPLTETQAFASGKETKQRMVSKRCTCQLVKGTCFLQVPQDPAEPTQKSPVE